MNPRLSASMCVGVALLMLTACSPPSHPAAHPTTASTEPSTTSLGKGASTCTIAAATVSDLRGLVEQAPAVLTSQAIQQATTAELDLQSLSRTDARDLTADAADVAADLANLVSLARRDPRGTSAATRRKAASIAADYGVRSRRLQANIKERCEP